MRYTYTPGQQGSTRPPTLVPTQHPSQYPTMLPSTQPSSSPSAAPSVSPQPTSQPSSSGPTNTYKPTVKPSQRPSTTPTERPTPSPTTYPTIIPTARPSGASSLRPSTSPSVTQTSTPTQKPTETPTRAPSVRITRAPTRMPSLTPTSGSSVTPTQATASAARSGLPGGKLTNIILSCGGGVIAFLWVAYCVYRIVQYCKWMVEKDKKRMLYLQASDAPAEPSYPILNIVIGYVCPVKHMPTEEVNDNAGLSKGTNLNGDVKLITSTSSGTLPFIGRGAFMESPASFVDLEANNRSNRTQQENSVSINNTVQIDNSSLSDEESLYSNRSDASSDVDVTQSAEPSQGSEYTPSLASDVSSVVYSLDDESETAEGESEGESVFSYSARSSLCEHDVDSSEIGNSGDSSIRSGDAAGSRNMSDDPDNIVSSVRIVLITVIVIVFTIM